MPDSLPPLALPSGIDSRYVDCTSSAGLTFHILEAGRPEPGTTRPLVLLCHGFPEIAYSWRHIIPSLASEGYHVVAPDQRGYGRTTGWDTSSFSDVDLNQFTVTNLVRDLVCLVYALGYRKVRCIIGHDFGAVSSAMAALMRPDLFTASIQMSHPHHAPPEPGAANKTDIQAELATLDPPRKHYKWYNSTAPAAHDWDNPAQGLEAYLRGYFHLKSGTWAHNTPHPLRAWRAAELAHMPEYYIMPLPLSMPATIAKNMHGEDATATESWLPPAALAVYAAEWTRTGFQGGLNWYRAQTSSTPTHARDMLLFAGRGIDVPTCFISGERDWGNFQQVGAIEAYGETCRDFRGVRLVEGAGHWVQQERPGEVLREVLAFLGGL
ncbi:hypothetical protein LTR28_003627 [Elasticomyces elasticus]|nr:hypothetical protein LTR28_003627 [Elasticomyces elasticus]